MINDTTPPGSVVAKLVKQGVLIMLLNFNKHAASNSRGEHYAAIGGHWPNQRRYIVERSGSEWRWSVHAHIPGRGFEEYAGGYTRTLKAGKAECDEWANPSRQPKASAETDT
jgi:hypothetical protein